MQATARTKPPDGLTIRFGQASLLLLFLLASSLIATALPIRLLDPAWHLSVVDLLIANAPIAITSACLGALSLGFLPTTPPDPEVAIDQPGTDATKRRRQLPVSESIPLHIHALLIAKAIRDWIAQIFTPQVTKGGLLRSKFAFQRICMALFWIYLAIIPSTLIAAPIAANTIANAHHSRLKAFEDQQKQISQRIASANSFAELYSLLSPTTSGPIPKLLLDDQKALFRQGLRRDQARFLARSARERGQRLQRLTINTFRVIPAALLVSLFFRLLSRLFFQRTNGQERHQLVALEELIP